MPRQIFRNATIFTGRSETDFASAFSITDGRFDWVGDSSEVQDHSAVDLGGRTVVPGFIDSHIHLAGMTAYGEMTQLFPPDVASVDDVVAALQHHPAAGKGPGDWIVGRGFDETKFAGRRMPTAEDLDRVSTTQPVMIWRCDSHSAVCNTRALELAGVTEETADPPGARFERDGDGRPNGVLTELAATGRVAAVIPRPDRQRQVAMLLQLGQDLLSRGIVGACDMMSTRIDDPLSVFRSAAEAGMATKVALYPGWDPARPLSDLTPADRRGDVKIAGVKVVLDGTYSNRTAWVHEPYPGTTERGLRVVEDDDLRAAADWARRNLVQLAIHAMGDRALDHIVDMFADEQPWLPDIPSIRLEHATIVSEAFAQRLRQATMTFGIATHTVFFFAEYDGYHVALHPDQIADAYPLARLYRTLQPLALSSDRPATAWSDADDVFLSTEAAVRRVAYNGAPIGPTSAIGVPQSLLLYTGRARLLSPLEGLGAIDAGEDGTFAVLDRDVFTVPDDEISHVRVMQTWVRGEKLYDRSA